MAKVSFSNSRRFTFLEKYDTIPQRNSESGQEEPKLAFIALNATELSKLVGISKASLSPGLTMVINKDMFCLLRAQKGKRCLLNASDLMCLIAERSESGGDKTP